MINPELALRMVRESPVIALDTETTGLTAKDIPCGWVVTDKSNSVYTPVRHANGGNIPNAAEFEAELAKAFLDRSRLGLRICGHNVGFDLRAALRVGVAVLGPVECTMINEALINDLTIGYSLGDCAERHGIQAKKGAELYAEIARKFGGLPDVKQMRHFHKMPGDDPIVVEYATGDGISTLQLWEAQQALLDRDDLRRVWKLECDLIPYLARMHHRGLRIDGEYAGKVVGEVNAAIEAALRPFAQGFNARSPKEVEALYRMNGYTDSVFARTSTGQVSFTEKWLETNDIGQAILGVRRLEKARDSFIAPLIDTQNINGRVHPVLNQSKSDDYGVAGARLSCSEPNLQAYPKRNIDVGRVVRRLVVPDDGFLIEEADAMQQEPRLFTHFSEEPDLVDGYRNGTEDIHDRASRILKLPRETAKRLGMGMLTMMSVPTLAKHMRWGEDEAREAHRAFLGAFPKIAEFQQLAVHVYRRRGYVKTILGRRAYLDDPRFSYRGVSRVIQNNGGDHCKLCLLRANQYEDSYSDQIQILLSIHDSIIWQRDPSHNVADLTHSIEGVARELGIAVPIPYEVNAGTNWAEASYGDKLNKYGD